MYKIKLNITYYKSISTSLKRPYTSYDQSVRWICIWIVSSSFIFPNQFHLLRSIPRPLKRSFANALSSYRNSWNCHFSVEPSRSSSIRFLFTQFCENYDPTFAFCVCWLAKSRMEQNQANTVVSDDMIRVLDKNVVKNQCSIADPLSWWRNQELSAHNSALFTRTASRKQRKTLK